MTKTVLGIIGGSGVYDIAGLENAPWWHVETPWGEASDDLLFGRIAGVEVVFLPRHGRGHVHSPTSINYRANIDALKRVGCTDIISISACGSLREDLPPGHFVLADQFIDRTHAREKTFFGAWFRRPCLTGASGLSTAADSSGGSGARGADTLPHRRNLSRNGRSAILHPGGIEALSFMGLRRHRNDCDAGGKARPRSRTALRASSQW